MNITTKRLKEIIMEEVQNATSPVTEAEEQEEKEEEEEEKPKANFDRHGPGAKRDKDGNRVLNKEDIARIIHEETVKAVKEGVVDMDGETVITGPDGDASPEAQGLARQDDLQATMLKAAMEIKNNSPQTAYETLLRALAAAGMDEKYLDDFLGYGELDEMYAGYSRGGARGSSYSGFPPAQARDLAKRLAAMGRNRSLSYGDERALNDWVGQQKFSTSREARAAIIDYLVGKRFGNRADYR